MIAVVHPTGNPNVRGLLSTLQDAGLLHRYFTGLGFHRQDHWISLVPGRCQQTLRRRSYHVSSRQFARHPWPDLWRLASARWRPGHAQERVDSVYRQIDQWAARKLARMNPGDLAGVYAYEDGAASLFSLARERGWKRFYELPIGYWQAARDILSQEALCQPEWAPTLATLHEPPEKLERKCAEIEGADHIVVASGFTRSTLPRSIRESKPVSLIPYGSPPPGPRPRPNPTLEPLRVLFVGGLSQRKGLSYLFSAADQMKARIRLTIVGRRNFPCPPLDRALARHSWYPTLPHNEVLKLMRSQDVLVFPSLFEGFGLVILEAMSQGLPVIATPHTAAPDVITDGQDGYVIPIRSTDSIVEKLTLLDQDRHRLDAMKLAAWKNAQRFSWECYAERLLKSIRQELKT